MLSNIERQQDLNYQTENQTPNAEQIREQIVWERRRVHKLYNKIKAKEEFANGVMNLIRKVRQDPRARDPQQQLDFIYESLEHHQTLRRENKLRVREELQSLYTNSKFKPF
tara:strand:- start:1197 stop:1529 length:333 start_codon:yes stop_codon:yes gene_type:complete